MSTRPMIALVCKQCDIVFHRSVREVNRQIRNGRRENQVFCSRACSRRWGNDHQTPEQIEAKKRPKISPEAQARGIAAARLRNTKGQFTHYLNKARSRSNHRSGQRNMFDLTESYLQDLWNTQQGNCAWTGIPLTLVKTTTGGGPRFYSASLDRIDSAKGYIQGNVQFVLSALNLAKGNGSDREFVEFLTKLLMTSQLPIMSD